MTIEFSDVTFTYPGAEGPALKDVSFSIEAGRFALVVGATGSGKSTLLRAVNGLVPHFSGGTFEGAVEVAGRSTLDHPPRRLADVVAFVPQEPARSFVLDVVEDELAYAMENLAFEPQMMRRRVEETLDLLDIASLRTRSVGSLSGGEKQRVAIAAALTPGARILVLDEPTSQLDPQGAEDVLAALHRLVHELGITVVAAEHRLERIVGFADLIVRCAEGLVHVSEPAAALRESELAPPVTRVARLLGWDAIPLTVRDARREATVTALPPPALEDPGAPGEPVLTVRAATAGYGRTPVLRSIDLDLAPEEIVALIGRNGAGKTTLLRCMTGIHPLTTGVIRVHGRPPEPGRDVALCPQAPEDILFADTVHEEIAATARGNGDQSRLGDGFLDQIGHRHPRDLSSDQRVWTAVLATATTGAPVVLLDEPTRGLDPGAKSHLVSMLKSFARSGTAVMLATHDVELVAALASRVVMLAAGELIADGPPTEVLSDSAVFSPQMTRVFGRGWLTPEQVAAAAASA